MAIPCWKLIPAVTSGNTVVIKPATYTPATVANLMQVFDDAGFPPGAVNLVTGGGGTVGTAIVDSPDVGIISFTGSSDVGRKILERSAKTLKKVSLELGGKNAQLVMDDANLELALEGVLWGAFGTTGQRCTATSRLILHEKIHDKFLQMLVDAVSKLKLGNGLDESVDVGPLVSESQLNTVSSYVEIGKEEGAELIIGGERATDGALSQGPSPAGSTTGDGSISPPYLRVLSGICASFRRRYSDQFSLLSRSRISTRASRR